MGDDLKPQPLTVTEAGAIHAELGRLCGLVEAQQDLTIEARDEARGTRRLMREELAKAREERTAEITALTAKLPCLTAAACPTPPKRSGSAEYQKVPPPTAAPGQDVSINQLIDWMDRLSVARASQFKRWAALLGSLAATAALWTGWKSCDVEGRIAALAARPAVVQPVAVPQPIIVRAKPDAE